MDTLPAFERDAFLRSLLTDVRDRGVEDGRPYVVLADTILYPEGGGQPSDRGHIAGVPVVDVRRVGGEIRHYLGAPPGAAAGPVEVGLDWERRFDHMQQHTAQHLLTALAQDRFGWATTAFHLGEHGADVELDVASLTRAQLDALEEAIAVEIRAARPVTARRVDPAAIAALPVRTRGLPEGFTGDVRLVEIAGIDLNTCGGTHLAVTAQIECVKLLGTEPMRGGTRLHFAAGGRARRLLGAHEARNAELRQLLGAPDDELAAVTAAKLDQLRDAMRRVRGLEEDLAASAAETLAVHPGPVVDAHWPERDAAFLQRVAKAFAPLAGHRVGLFTAGAASEGPFVLCAGEAVTVDLPPLAKRVAEALGGRGGGSGRIFQGKAGALERRATAVTLLVEALGQP